MTNYQHIAKLASAGRARVVRLDYPERVAVRLVAPSGGAPRWPANVVALRWMPYAEAVRVGGLWAEL